jgi:hypothetical protein
MGQFKEWMEATANPLQPDTSLGQLPQQLDQNTIQAVVKYLSQIQQAGFVLVGHQTLSDIAINIMKTQSFGRGSGLHGTSAAVNPQGLVRMVQLMHGQTRAVQNNQPVPHSGGQIHKGSNAVVVMAIPKSFYGRDLTDVDANLADLALQGVIPDMSLPNNYIVGVWMANGKFFGNGKFNPNAGPIK